TFPEQVEVGSVEDDDRGARVLRHDTNLGEPVPRQAAQGGTRVRKWRTMLVDARAPGTPGHTWRHMPGDGPGPGTPGHKWRHMPGDPPGARRCRAAAQPSPRPSASRYGRKMSLRWYSV